MKVTTDACLFGSSIPPNPLKGELKILDIGTGTGLLALMFAQKNPVAIIDVIEIDKDAAAQAKENAERSPWGKRINVINADAKEFPFTKKYDLIIMPRIHHTHLFRRICSASKFPYDIRNAKNISLRCIG